MKTEQLREYFRKIKEGTNGTDVSCPGEIIDYKNGNCIHIDDIEEEYYKYLELQEEIDDYIEDNDLDDCKSKDIDKIKEHFSSKVLENCFMYNQAVLKDFCDYMIEKINEKNSNYNEE